MRLKVIGDEKECTLVIPADMVIKGDVNLSDMGLTKLPDLSAVTVNGNFDCIGNRLTSLEGAPKSVGGDFDCAFNELTSLKGAPKSVGGGFYCYDNQLTSLDDAPKSVGGDFDCSGNKLLMSLGGVSQEIGGKFICDNRRLVQESKEIQQVRFAAKQKEISVGLARQAKQRKK